MTGSASAFGLLLLAACLEAGGDLNATVLDIKPDAPILAGGALIVAGGLVITFWRA